MESEKRYKGWTIDQSGNPLVVLNDGANMEMNDAISRLNALEAERDRYKAALEYIESTPTTWTLGVDENMERLRTIATQALGGGDE